MPVRVTESEVWGNCGAWNLLGGALVLDCLWDFGVGFGRCFVFGALKGLIGGLRNGVKRVRGYWVRSGVSLCWPPPYTLSVPSMAPFPRPSNSAGSVSPQVYWGVLGFVYVFPLFLFGTTDGDGWVACSWN